jgi:predicted Zn-dependent protease
VPIVQTPVDPADAIAADAKALADAGKVDKAIDMLVKARATYPDRASLPLLAGKLYFAKLWWTDGIASFRAAFKLDPSLKVVARRTLRGWRRMRRSPSCAGPERSGSRSPVTS